MLRRLREFFKLCWHLHYTSKEWPVAGELHDMWREDACEKCGAVRIVKIPCDYTAHSPVELVEQDWAVTQHR